MGTRTWTDNDLIEAVKVSKNKTEVLKKLGLSYHNSGNYQTIGRYLKKLEIDTTHFEWGVSHVIPKNKIPLEQILIKNSTYNGVHLKNRLIKEGLLEEKCDDCGILEWQGQELSLHLDHINGDRTDNQLNNLRLLCPNCHSLTPTYCVGMRVITPENNCIDCGKIIQPNSTRCVLCEGKTRRGKGTKIDWPNSETLRKMVENLGWVGTAQQLGVTDNGVRKRLKNHP